MSPFMGAGALGNSSILNDKQPMNIWFSPAPKMLGFDLQALNNSGINNIGFNNQQQSLGGGFGGLFGQNNGGSAFQNSSSQNATNGPVGKFSNNNPSSNIQNQNSSS